jgi:nicotinic acid mononucleotide adenylyltransferase
MNKPTAHYQSTVLFSGRFDPPSIGHAATIMRLSEQFKEVVVIVLHQKGRRWPADFAIQAFEEVFKNTKNVVFVKNATHFARVSEEELKKYGGHYYASGNIKCLNHVAQFMPVVYTDRAYGLAASGYKGPVKE